MEDLSQIMGHDLSSQKLSSEQSGEIQCPQRACGRSSLHALRGELEAGAGGSVFGLARFLIGKFPIVVNKILPDVPPREIQAILMDDPEYFNDLAYDDVVGGLANILFAAKGAFQKDMPPSRQRR